MRSISLRLTLAIALGMFLVSLITRSAAVQAQACPTTLTLGTSAQCTLAAPAEVDQFTITAQVGDTLIIRASRTSGSVQPRLRLRTSQGVPVDEVFTYGAVAELDSTTLPATDTYTLFLDDRQGSGTGAYAVSIQRLNGPVQTAALSFGATQPATLLVGGELDAYSISGQQGDRLLLRMSSGPGGFHPQVRLYQPDGTLVCSGYGYGTTVTNSKICQLPVTGAYLVLANEWNEGRTGSYYLFAQRLNNPLAGTPIAFGVGALATLATPGEADTFTVDGVTGDALAIRMGRGSGTVQPALQLYAPDGTLVCSASSYGAVAGRDDCLLPQTGRYTLLTYDFQEGRTGSYGAFVQRLNAPGQAVALPRGVPTAGQIALPGELRTYLMSGAQGEVLVARVASGASLSPFMALYGPGGVAVCSGLSYGQVVEIGPCILPADGAYTLLLGDFDEASTGGYTLHLQSLTNLANAVALPFGYAMAGSLATPGQINTYAFRGDAGAKLRVRAVGSGDGINPSVRLYTPDGLSVCSASTYGTTVETGDCLLPTSGAYTLLVNDFYQANTGSYSVNLTCLTASCGPGPSYIPTYLPLVRR